MISQHEISSKYTLRDKLILLLLSMGVICFGFVFPDSLSDHDKLVHFSAHLGMSFLFALSFYALLSVKFRWPKSVSYTILVSATLAIGVVYKFLEISTAGRAGNESFQTMIDRTGCLTSMSQNLAGVMTAMIVIESLLQKNLVSTLMGSSSFHTIDLTRPT